jgi:hypothetical protein
MSAAVSSHPNPPPSPPPPQTTHRYFARVLIGNTAWVVGESGSASSAARLHDLAAIAVFGVSALPHISTPPPYGYEEMQEVVQSLARQVGGSVVKYKRML